MFVTQINYPLCQWRILSYGSTLGPSSSMKTKPLFMLLLCWILLQPCLLAASEHGRFFYEGNGVVKLKSKNTQGKIVESAYRKKDGHYDPTTLSEINSLFGMPAESIGDGVSLRLIALLDYLEDKFAPGKTLLLTSTYRSPQFNESLRKQGKLAGKTSYHMEGMAADVVFPGANAKEIWEYVKSLDCCGIGHYGGNTLHIDSGKPRFWTAATALPLENEDPQNRNIYLVTDRDYYKTGELMLLQFTAVSNYPFGLVSEFKIFENDREVMNFLLGKTTKKTCSIIEQKKDSQFFYWTIPDSKKLKGKKLTIEATFCHPTTPKMPANVRTRPFIIF